MPLVPRYSTALVPVMLLALALPTFGSLDAEAGKIEVLRLGQAATRITIVSGKVVVIDPFLTQNSKTPAQDKNLDALGKVDLILVAHAHSDHPGDTAVATEMIKPKFTIPIHYGTFPVPKSTPQEQLQALRRRHRAAETAARGVRAQCPRPMHDCGRSTPWRRPPTPVAPPPAPQPRPSAAHAALDDPWSQGQDRRRIRIRVGRSRAPGRAPGPAVRRRWGFSGPPGCPLCMGRVMRTGVIFPMGRQIKGVRD